MRLHRLNAGKRIEDNSHVRETSTRIVRQPKPTITRAGRSHARPSM